MVDAASGSQPARGVLVGRLNESHPDRIVVGSSILYLREGGPTCTHSVGTLLGVTYTEEEDGRRHVVSLEPMSE
jgi:hypothetical protein